MTPPKRIVWMLDETLIKSDPSHWPAMRQQVSKFVTNFGNPNMEHFVADPEPLLKKLGEQLVDKNFSCLIDLSGWMSEILEPIINTNQVVNNFHLSRIREASSPSLPTSGYIINMNNENVHQLKVNLDLSNPLILDDTSFSGNTSLITMKILGINPQEATHAFLIANEGNLGQNPGAKSILENSGSSVLSGMSIHTPEDDGWHVEDIWNHPKLDLAITLAALSQEIMDQHGINSPEAKAIWSAEQFSSIQFLQRIDPKTTSSLIEERRLISQNPDRLLNGEVHTKNPLLWISPYFIQHINLPLFLENHQQVSQELANIKSFMREDLAPRQEAINELKRSIEGYIFSGSKERRL